MKTLAELEDTVDHKINNELATLHAEIADYCEEGTTIVVYLTTGAGAECEFHIQTVGGIFKPAANCEFWGKELKTGEFSAEEEKVWEICKSEIISYAENYYADFNEDRYVKHDLKFNTALNNCDYYLREDTENSVFEIVSEDHLINEYDDEITILKSFETKEAAFEFADQFRTDDHHDAQGLFAMIEAIDCEELLIFHAQ